MTPSERRRQSHNWSAIERAIDQGWQLTISKDQQRRYKAILDCDKDIYTAKPAACLEWALDEIDEWLEDEFA